MVDGFWEETIVANGFLKDFYNSTIAIESMVLQSTIGDDGFSMVNEEKKDNGFQKSRFTTKNYF